MLELEDKRKSDSFSFLFFFLLYLYTFPSVVLYLYTFFDQKKKVLTYEHNYLMKAVGKGSCKTHRAWSKVQTGKQMLHLSLSFFFSIKNVRLNYIFLRYLPIFTLKYIFPKIPIFMSKKIYEINILVFYYYVLQTISFWYFFIKNINLEFDKIYTYFNLNTNYKIL